MSTTIHDIEAFSEFAREKLNAGADLNLVDLAAEWQFRHQSDAELREDTPAVQESLDAIDQGEPGRLLSEFDADFPQRHGIA